mmetsp:Transcript_36341/g.114723  ORF Transcript_36341/g.114723 Transcript_36341/m.114723 type:complete len:392 (-) Transcript_36341:2481-3656(-)
MLRLHLLRERDHVLLCRVRALGAARGAPVARTHQVPGARHVPRPHARLGLSSAVRAWGDWGVHADPGGARAGARGRGRRSWRGQAPPGGGLEVLREVVGGHGQEPPGQLRVAVHHAHLLRDLVLGLGHLELADVGAPELLRAPRVCGRPRPPPRGLWTPVGGLGRAGPPGGFRARGRAGPLVDVGQVKGILRARAAGAGLGRLARGGAVLSPPEHPPGLHHLLEARPPGGHGVLPLGILLHRPRMVLLRGLRHAVAPEQARGLLPLLELCLDLRQGALGALQRLGAEALTLALSGRRPHGEDLFLQPQGRVRPRRAKLVPPGHQARRLYLGLELELVEEGHVGGVLLEAVERVPRGEEVHGVPAVARPVKGEVQEVPPRGLTDENLQGLAG